jgi:hypothetical protein
LQPATGQYINGETVSFILNLKLEPKECINTIEAEINFDTQYLIFKDFLSGQSIINLWVDQPSSEKAEAINQTGLIKLSGGLPGGYCGNDNSVAPIGELVFQINPQVSQETSTFITVATSSKVLLNDGQGTAKLASSQRATLNIFKKENNLEAPTTTATVLNDAIPPEPFTIAIYQDPNIYGGKKYIIFNAIDKQSGVDYYEISESKTGCLDSLFGNSKWTIIKSPHILINQNVNGIIRVKAVDKAGNKRMAELDLTKLKSLYSIVGVVILLIIIIMVLFLIIKKLKKKYAKKS